MSVNLPENRPLTLADFQQLPKGSVLILYYNCVNQGTFVWLHDRVQGKRVWGQFAYSTDKFTEISDYLSEYAGSLLSQCKFTSFYYIMTLIKSEYCFENGQFGWLQQFEDPFGFVEEIFESEEELLLLFF